MDGVKILASHETKLVLKPWGQEQWLTGDPSGLPYAMKALFIKAAARTSLQFHGRKHETGFMLKGEAIFRYSAQPIDASRYTRGGYGPQELQPLLDGLVSRKLVAGDLVHIAALHLHQFQAVTDVLLVEASTSELDDVFRLQDDTGRAHGRIESEHV